MHLTLLGSGLCAQVTAAALASTGHDVQLCMDEVQHWQAVMAGHSLFREPGLDNLLAEQRASGKLAILRYYQPARQGVQRVFLTLAPNQLAQAEALVDQLAALPELPVLLINQSTFPVGTTEALQQRLNAGVADTRQRVVVSLPDLMQEGAAIQGFTRAEHWLLGCDNAWAENQIREILRPFNRRRDHLLVMSPREAEFTKLAITGMLATRLSFMNDMANLADALQVDIERIRQGMGADPRIGEQYLYPGCGFGGLSFSRDVMSLATTLESSGVGSELLEEVLVINERQKEILFRKLWQHFETDLRGRSFALWGAAFKPGSDRIDNAPILRLLQALWAQGASVRVHDPRALSALAEWAGARDDLILCEDPYQALIGADALLLVTEWKIYWSPDFERIRAQLKQPVILDGRNVYDPAYLRAEGFVYYGVGR